MKNLNHSAIVPKLIKIHKYFETSVFETIWDKKWKGGLLILKEFLVFVDFR